jgi:DNA repair protein SbcC/Rad50
MIIRKIILDNIRSYTHEKIELTRGSTLLAGDIGCGKTSILLAIEFALFGLQPGQRGSALLRNSADEGGVKMLFEIGNQEVFVERTLKRGKTVSQDYAAITIDGEKIELSVTELKNKVLELLNYPREFSKKQNLLYKFTVYTPQEEMKQIILEDQETRVNTLRHVFGVDKYKKILENVALVRLKLREEKRLMQGIISNLDEEETQLERKKQDADQMKNTLVEFAGELFLSSEKTKQAEFSLKEIQGKIDEKRNLSEELGKSKILLVSRKESFENNNKIILDLTTEINEFKKLNFSKEKFQEVQTEILNLKRQKEKISSMNIEINSKISSLTLKVEDNQHLHSKLSDLQACPTCLQEVDSIHRANVLNKSHNEISRFSGSIKELELEKLNTKEKLSKLEVEINFKEKELAESRILIMKAEVIENKKNKLRELIPLQEKSKQDLDFLDKHAQNLNDALLEFSKFDRVFEEKQTTLQETSKKERMSEIKVAEVKKEIEFFTKTIEELEERIKKIKKVKEKLDHISDLESWLANKFIPVVSAIESNVMRKLKSEFSRLFSEWFAILVPESFNVRLSNNFTPIIEQQDYEIDYSYLSGGERTAIALAYRLSLNQVINSLMSRLKTRDLVILDEPTDGFSEQQLDKMREVLDQLKTEQMIIVSHEQKIEGFVENVIRFEKQHGESRKA